MRAVRDKVERGVPRGGPIGIIDHDDAIVRKERFRKPEPLQLVHVAVIPIIEVEPNRLCMHMLEVLGVVHFPELVPRALELVKPCSKRLLRGLTAGIPIPHGEVIDSNTGLPWIAQHASDERESLPDADV